MLETEPTPITYQDWMVVALEEYRRLGLLLDGLTAEQWRLPTDCDEWDVHAMVSHLIGAARAAGSPREAVRQLLVGRRLRDHGEVVDKMNDAQVAERREREPAQLVAELADAARTSVPARRRLPAFARALRIVPFGPPWGYRPLGYLMGRIYTRDAWMHRIDICRATAQGPTLTPDHDGRIVADVVAEWAAAHGASYRLELTGPAGGQFRRGTDGEEITVDAVDFCRILSGRAAGTALLSTPVPF